MLSVSGQATEKADATTDLTTSERPLHDYVVEVSERTDVRVGVPLPLGTYARGEGHCHFCCGIILGERWRGAFGEVKRPKWAGRASHLIEISRLLSIFRREVGTADRGPRPSPRGTLTTLAPTQ